MPDLQLNIDATIMSQAFIGATYIKRIALGEINEYLTGTRDESAGPVRLVTRVRFNPNLKGFWFGGVMEAINNVTMLTIILVGAAFIREREHGTVEHLLVMPLTPFEIMLAKIWANGLAVLLGVAFALAVMVERVLQVPIAGSLPLFLAAAACYLFAAASIGIFLGTLARSMPQFGLLVILSIIPLLMLSGGISPRESMPQAVQDLMLAAPHHLLRPPRPGHPLPWRRPGDRLARPRRDDRYRRRLFRHRAGEIPRCGDAESGGEGAI